MRDRVIFKRVGAGRPYPEHGLGPGTGAALPPRQVRLDELVTTKDTLELAALLDEDSTFFGDLFAHVVEWHGELYLEDGLHRALRAALQQRQVLHARVHLIAAEPWPTVQSQPTAGTSWSLVTQSWWCARCGAGVRSSPRCPGQRQADKSRRTPSCCRRR